MLEPRGTLKIFSYFDLKYFIQKFLLDFLDKIDELVLKKYYFIFLETLGEFNKFDSGKILCILESMCKFLP